MKIFISKKTFFTILTLSVFTMGIQASISKKIATGHPNTYSNYVSSSPKKILKQDLFAQQRENIAAAKTLSVGLCYAAYVEDDDIWVINLCKDWDGVSVTYPDIYIAVRTNSPTSIAGTFAAEIAYIETDLSEQSRHYATEITSALVVKYLSKNSCGISLSYKADDGNEYTINANRLPVYAYNYYTQEEIILEDQPNVDSGDDNSGNEGDNGNSGGNSDNEGDNSGGDTDTDSGDSSQLDSLVMFVSEEKIRNTKTEYIYNKQNVMTGSITKKWDKANKNWVNENKLENLFDKHDNIIGSLSSIWDANYEQWKNSSKMLMTLDDDNHITQTLNLKWDDNTNDWVNSSKTDNIYDSNGNYVEKQNSIWEEDAWLLEEITTMAYDSTGNEIGVLIKRWDANKGMIVNFSKTETIYDKDDNDINIIYIWDAIAEEWAYSQKTERERDSDGNIIMTATSIWNTNLESWVYINKMETFYEDETQTEIRYNWNNEWVPTFETIITFDDKGNSLEALSLTWNATTEEWVNNSKSENIYNNANNIKESNSYVWNANIEEWVLNSKLVYYYSKSLPADFQNIQVDSLSTKIFFNGQIMIVHKGDLYNLQGKKVQSL